jgi:histidyl-tRNA synthetase
MDVWGEPDVSAEAELIAAIFHALDALGLAPGDVKMRLNHRALLEESLRAGVLAQRPEAFAPLCVIVDKLPKIGRDAVIEQLTDAAGAVQLARSDAEAAVALLEAKGLDDAARLAGTQSPALAQLRRLFELLGAYGVADRVAFDASVVRGLAYYTGVVFEAFDAAGSLRAVCGGGRYDRLLETLGGRPLPAVGFGFGDAVIMELLAERGKLPQLARSLDAVVFPLGEEERDAAVRLASRLRREGKSVELVLGALKPKRVFADANKAGARHVYVIGPEERARGVVRVKDLATEEQRDEPLPETPPR